MKKLSVKNYNKVKLLNIFIYSFLMISVFIPLLITLFLESSEIAQVLINNPLILIFLISLQIYFFYLGSYYSKIKIDQPNINVILNEKNKKDLIKLYDDHDIFILPSFTEGHPMSLLEALARRRPVIIFD